MSSKESQTLSSDSTVKPPQQEQSKKAAKKETAKQEKLFCRQEGSTLASAAQSIFVEDDPLATNYGDVPLLELQSKVEVNDWTEVGLGGAGLVFLLHSIVEVGKFVLFWRKILLLGCFWMQAKKK